jgi:hypothetical protein
MNVFEFTILVWLGSLTAGLLGALTGLLYSLFSGG